MANPKILHSGVGSNQSVYETSTTRHHDIGEVGVLPGGRVFRYGRYIGSAAVSRGKLCVTATQNAQNEQLACATNAMVVGNNKITDITLGTVSVATTEKFQYLLVDGDDGGSGLCFRIRSHPTASASATDFQVTLFDTIPVASDASTTVSLVKDQYADFQLGVTDQADVPVGAPLVALADSSSTTSYTWLQTSGIGPAWVNGTPAEGTQLMPDTTTAGNLTAFSETITISIADPATPTMTTTPSGTDTVNLLPVVAQMLSNSNVDDDVAGVVWTIKGIC